MPDTPARPADQAADPDGAPPPPPAAGGGMHRLIRDFDWAATPLGPRSGWPQSLRSALSICLDSNFPIAIYWGDDLVLLYNDEWSPIPGEKHPWALGRPAREAWPEIWHIIEPLFGRVLTAGEATRSRDQLLPMHRHGFTEECYFDYTFSPIRGDGGRVEGVFNAVLETTTRVIDERRLRTLRELGAWKVGEARTAEEACAATVHTLAANPHDLPFTLLYLLDGDGRRATLAGRTGLGPDTGAGPAAVDLDSPDAPWPFGRVAETGRAVEVDGLSARFGPLPGGAWPESPERAVVLPVAKAGQTRPAGFLVAGVSPRLALTDDYRGFLDLLAGHVATAVANARAYEEEKRRAEALAELDRAKTAFFSNVSHEFRTPLTLMLGPVEDLLARSHTDLPPAAAEQLDVVDRNGRRLLRLVNSLLDFSRIEAGRVRAAFRPTDLAAVTADLASGFRSACERAGLRLVVDCPPLPEPVYVDREMWEKVVLNLLSNAFKFTFEGEIRVEVRGAERGVRNETEAGEGLDSASRAPHSALLTVRDTGTGVPAAEVPRLFERFHRVQNARGRTHEGSGIGLALVQELVRLHGGAITAASEVGVGTTFTVTVPLGTAHLPPDQVGTDRTDAPTGSAATPYVEEALRWLPGTGVRSQEAEVREDGGPVRAPDFRPLTSGPRVLVADDNADMREYVARLLADQYRVEAVADGEAALAAARANPPDLILSDVMMPRLDGFGVLKAVRADPALSGVPVILLSARAGEESRVEGMEAGADDYLVKPFGAKELQARVSAHVKMARLRREANDTLRASEARFRELADAMPQIVWTAGPDGRIDYLNRRWAGYTGLPPTVGNAGWGHVLHPDDGPPAAERWAASLATGRPFEAELRLLDGGRKAYRWHLVRTVAVRTEAGAARWFGTATDVHDQKRGEQTARFLSDASAALAVLVDSDSTLQKVASLAVPYFADWAAVDVLGADGALRRVAVAHTDPAKVQLARDLHRRFPPDPAAPTGVWNILRTGEAELVPEITDAMLAASVADGELLGVMRELGLRSYIGVPLAARGRTLGVLTFIMAESGHAYDDTDLAVARDLASRAGIAVENSHLYRELREADRRKDEFLATLAHELRNPLAPLRNGLQLMRLAPRTDPAAVEKARGMMERQLGLMVRLIDDLMDVSRISRGKVALKAERVDLAEVIRQAVETSRPLIDDRGHALAVDLPAEPIHLDADPARLAQVFANLLNNAAKYTDRGGRITLAVGRHGGDAVVGVRDTGVGIPAAMLPKVFDLFTQVDRSLEKAQGGLGIGLSLVKGLVELHGGTVEARSGGHGAGSEFVVRLPVAADAAAAERSAGPEAEPPPARRRVLVVDDNTDAADSLAMLLEMLGSETRTAHDGLAGSRRRRRSARTWCCATSACRS